VTPVDRQPVNRQDEWWEKPGRVEDLRLRFKPDGLLRLARSTPEYYESHGHYLPGLAVLAYLDGQRVRDLEAALRVLADASSELDVALAICDSAAKTEDHPDGGEWIGAYYMKCGPWHRVLGLRHNVADALSKARAALAPAEKPPA
jgi:hypothetical protein